VRRQVVGHEDPAGLGVRRNRLLDVGCEVSLVPRLLYGWGDHFAGRHFEVADQRLRTVPYVFGLAFFDVSGPHGLDRGGVLERLNAGLFIDADRMDSFLFQPLRRSSIRRAHLAHLLLEGHHVFRIGIEPVATLVRLKFRRLLKNVRLVGRKW